MSGFRLAGGFSTSPVTLAMTPALLVPCGLGTVRSSPLSPGPQRAHRPSPHPACRCSRGTGTAQSPRTSATCSCSRPRPCPRRSRISSAKSRWPKGCTRANSQSASAPTPRNCCYRMPCRASYPRILPCASVFRWIRWKFVVRNHAKQRELPPPRIATPTSARTGQRQAHRPPRDTDSQPINDLASPHPPRLIQV